MVVPLLLAVASSVLTGASFLPINLEILIWFGLSPFLFALSQKGFTGAAVLGFVYGGLFGAVTFYWANYIATVSLITFLIMLVTFSFFFLAFGILYTAVNKRVGFWIILGAPALWVAMEYVRSNLFFLSMPWNLLGQSQYRFPSVIQIADITGVYGISFLIVMVNQFLSEIPDFMITKRRPARRGNARIGLHPKWGAKFIPIVLGVGLTLYYGGYNLTDSNKHQTLRVALVQANLLARDNMPWREQAEYLGSYRKLTLEAARGKPDLVVWPASSLPAPISSRVVQYITVRLARETGAYLLVGGAGHEKDRERQEGDLPYSNSEFLISPSGHLQGQYNKIRLLAFNEYLPLQEIIPWPEWITTIRGSFIRGEEYTLFQVSGAKFGAPICWENMFPDFFRRFVKDGANFMVNVTNEGFFGNTSTPYYQSLAISAIRAVENRVAIVRSATTGVSCIIHPNGEIAERITDGNGKDLSVAGFLVRDIPLSNKKTFYTLYGDIFAYLTMGLAILVILISLISQRRDRSQRKE